MHVKMSNYVENIPFKKNQSNAFFSFFFKNAVQVEAHSQTMGETFKAF